MQAREQVTRLTQTGCTISFPQTAHFVVNHFSGFRIPLLAISLASLLCFEPRYFVAQAVYFV
jgi:hypothetical protein